MPERGIAIGNLKSSLNGRMVQSDGTIQSSIPGVQGANNRTTNAIAIDTVIYYPMVVDHPISVDQLTISVQTAGGASTVARLGIYHAGEDFQPLGLVVDAGTVAVDSTGIKNLAVSPAELLLPGKYLMAINSDAAPTLHVILTAHMMWGGIKDDASSTNLFVAKISATQTFAVFPDPGAVWTSVSPGAVGFFYGMWLRVAAL